MVERRRRYTLCLIPVLILSLFGPVTDPAKAAAQSASHRSQASAYRCLTEPNHDFIASKVRKIRVPVGAVHSPIGLRGQV
ncbi:MAG: hypothetical protein HY788_08640 [Deltaproteobacteria bacterium]|nr:hypothetical protein [Deltaproteobacteria bacterium]